MNSDTAGGVTDPNFPQRGRPTTRVPIPGGPRLNSPDIRRPADSLRPDSPDSSGSRTPVPSTPRPSNIPTIGTDTPPNRGSDPGSHGLVPSKSPTSSSVDPHDPIATNPAPDK